jgi:hypothetical protein
MKNSPVNCMVKIVILVLLTLVIKFYCQNKRSSENNLYSNFLNYVYDVNELIKEIKGIFRWARIKKQRSREGLGRYTNVSRFSQYVAIVEACFHILL